MVLMDADWVTVLTIVYCCLFVVLYWFYVLPFEKAKKAALITSFVGAISFTAVLYNLLGKLPIPPGLIIGFMWLWPTAIILTYKNHFRNLEQKKLVGLQIFRLIGGLFILEMVRGNIPDIFAFPAGVGDIIVGLSALYFLISYKQIPRYGVITVLILGLADFGSALFFGITSSLGPLQIFARGFDNQINLFPTGLIPLFLVPYAIAFHALSYINLEKHKN